jgi:hypothetical protein
VVVNKVKVLRVRDRVPKVKKGLKLALKHKDFINTPSP